MSKWVNRSFNLSKSLIHSFLGKKRAISSENRWANSQPCLFLYKGNFLWHPYQRALKGQTIFYYYFYFFVALGLYCIHLTKENPSIGPFCSLPHFVKLSVPTNRFIIYIYILTFFGISVLVPTLVFQYQPKFDVQVSACMETVYPRKQFILETVYPRNSLS